jgi:hypothetical protein
MTDQDLLKRKIQSYLGELSPRAVAMLARSLERSQGLGQNEPHAGLILAAALAMLSGGEPDVAAVQDTREKSVRRNWRQSLERSFFAPLDAFAIDEQLPHKQEGRIYRPYLHEFWLWLERDVMADDISRAMEFLERRPCDDERVHRIAAALRKRAADALTGILESSAASEREARRLKMMLGGERALQDLADVMKVFKAEPWLRAFLRRIPESLSERALKQDEEILDLVSAYISRHPADVPVIAAAMLDRAEAPWSLGPFAERLAKVRGARWLTKTRFAPFAAIVVSEIERLHVLADEHRKNNPDPVAFSAALSLYAAAVSGVERDMDLTGAEIWSSRIAETRRNISAVVADELSGAAGTVRRALQVPKPGPVGEARLDETSLDAAVRVLRVLDLSRSAADILAVNEAGKRARQSVEQTLEIITRSLIADLAKAAGGRKDAIAAAADSAIMLCEICFGQDYAGLLRRSRQSALAAAA